MIKNKNKWIIYFEELLYEHVENLAIHESNTKYRSRDVTLFRKSNEYEVKFATLRRMKTGKTLEHDGITIEVWKCLCNVGVSCLVKLFNKIMM